MRIVGAHIHRYRGIRDLVVPFGRVTVLVGRNGAGKSSLLEALGFRPSEEGALERRGDEPPLVSWYLAPPADRSRAEFLQPLVDRTWSPDDARSRAAGRLGEHVVVAVNHDGRAELAFDAFAAAARPSSAQSVRDPTAPDPRRRHHGDVMGSAAHDRTRSGRRADTIRRARCRYRPHRVDGAAGGFDDHGARRHLSELARRHPAPGAAGVRIGTTDVTPPSTPPSPNSAGAACAPCIRAACSNRCSAYLNDE